MRDTFGEWRLLRLHTQGLQCDETGLALDGLALARRRVRPDGGAQWSPRPPEELEPALSRRFGAPVALATKRAELDLVARRLTDGELALAEIAALHLEFPDPPPLAKAALPPSPDLLRQLAASGLLTRDWNPDDDPRTGTPPNPGWFAPKDDGGQEVAENDKEPPQTMTDESQSLPRKGRGRRKEGRVTGLKRFPQRNERGKSYRAWLRR